MVDYLTVSNNIYIKNVDKEFLCYEYIKKKYGIFNILQECESYIIFSFLKLNLNEAFLLEAINLFSEMLYFIGNKNKDVIFCNHNIVQIDLSSIGFRYIKENEYIKSTKEFEMERINKFGSINDLYKYSYLVPWNLVTREWDVIDIVTRLVSKNEKILEIGSGYGKNLLLLNELGYKHVKGIEYSENACEIANKFEFNSKNNICGSIVTCDFLDDSFDVILDIGCLHCISNSEKIKAIKQVSRMLKGGGIIISRYFLPKDVEWLKRYPIRVDSFGNTEEEIREFMSVYFEIQNSYCNNGCVYIIGRVRK